LEQEEEFKISKLEDKDMFSNPNLKSRQEEVAAL